MQFICLKKNLNNIKTNNMDKEFISYKQALALKELGFDEPCFAWYHKGKLTFNELYNLPDINENTRNTSAPLYQQAFRWFREKHNLLGGVYSNASGWAWEIHDNIGGTHRFSSEYTGDCLESGMFTSFEEAELECLKKLIEIVKNK
jgi:hypothetical protein